MAGRIRTLKPEILDDEVTARLSDFQWRLFVSLILLADDYGNLRGNEGQVRGAAVWGTQATDEVVRAALDHLASVNLVRPYSVRGQRYLHIAGWSKHQRVKNPGKPLMPGPESADNPPPSTPGGGATSVLGSLGGESTENLPPDLDHDHDHDLDRQPKLKLVPVGGDPPGERQKSVRKKPEIPLPDDWKPTSEHAAKARELGLSLELEAQKFRNHALQNDRRCVRWDQAFSNWLLSAFERRIRSGQKPIAPTGTEPPRRKL